MKKLLTNEYVILALRLFIGGMFVFASITKILHPDKFAIAIDNYHFLPTSLVNLWALTLPWVELFVGLFLVAGIFTEGAALVSALMYVSFIIALSSALARGLDISCGCFEQAGQEKGGSISWLYLVRDSSLLAGSLIIAYGYRGKLAVEQLWRKVKS
jgi:uncharacterized membrane protein YphA (DoxX/SURF4 family)